MGACRSIPDLGGAVRRRSSDPAPVGGEANLGDRLLMGGEGEVGLIVGFDWQSSRGRWFGREAELAVDLFGEAVGGLVVGACRRPGLGAYS